jgi:hypothetical protein
MMINNAGTPAEHLCGEDNGRKSVTNLMQIFRGFSVSKFPLDPWLHFPLI